jgi:hypothetical protein
MKIHELAKSYLELKNNRDEKRRVIDYELKKKLSTLKSQAFDVESRLRVSAFEDTIKNEEKLFDQYDSEFQKVAKELLSLLTELKASRKDPLRTHVHGQIYIDTFIGEDGNIVSGSYHKVG